MKRAGGWTLLLAGPFLVLFPYMYLSRVMRTFTAATDDAALLAALACGVAGILLLLPTPRSRALAVAIYVPFAGLIMWMGMIVGCQTFFGDCP